MHDVDGAPEATPARGAGSRPGVAPLRDDTPPHLGDPASRFGDPRRWATFAVGLVCLFAGIGLSITAELGVGSWQVFETGLVELTGQPFGVVVLVEAAVVLAIAWRFLGQRPWIATVILGFGGVLIGAVLSLLDTPDALLGRSAMLAAGIGLIALGVAFYLASDLGASAQDALFVGLYETFGWRPGVVRFGLDASLVLTGALIGGQIGVGTIVMTVGVPVLIEPALRLGHRLAGTPLPESMRRGTPAELDVSYPAG